MKYRHTFVVQASHLNDDGYPHWRKYLDGMRQLGQSEYIPLDTRAKMLEDALRELAEAAKKTHGHNFEVTVTVDGPVPPNGWVVDSRELERIVFEWNDVNLSMHEDFVGNNRRATTENMATILAQKVARLIPRSRGSSKVELTVEVTERPGITATYYSTITAGGQ